MSEFEDLVDAHYQALYRFAMSMTRDAATAADLVQETFCIWAAKGHQLQDRSKAKTWLFTTLHREFLSLRRRASRFSDEPLDEATAEALTGPEDDADRQLDGQRALELLGSLEEIYRAPITLFYLQQHSYKDIAEILDVPIGTIMSRLSRGKEMLRRKMTAEPSSAPKNILQIQNDNPRQNHG
jgi:RNA polymerase sigma-70 factor (ECF subfamily)